MLVFDLPLAAPGRYRFEIDVGEEHAVVPLLAAQAPQTAAGDRNSQH